MEVNVVTNQFKDLWNKAKKVLIIAGEQGADSVAAALALKDILNSRAVSAYLVSEKIPGNVSTLSGASEIKQNLESKNLIISFDFVKNPIEKVSYKMEGNLFNLIVKPRRGNINLEEVHTSFTGGDYNLIITLGISDIKKLKAYELNRELFESLPSVNIDIDPSNTRFGKLNIVDSKAGSISALMALVLEEAGVKLPKKSASLLLAGIREATQNFTRVEGSRIFEAAAYVTRKDEETKDNVVKEDISGSRDKELPKDWLSPKVFRSSKVS